MKYRGRKMRMKVQPERIGEAGDRLRESSRKLRRAEEELYAAASLLRKFSEMEECLTVLRHVEDDLSEEMIRTLRMCTASKEIALIYRHTEEGTTEKIAEAKRKVFLHGFITRRVPEIVVGPPGGPDWQRDMIHFTIEHLKTVKP
jgi:hypothetical protein